MIDQQYIEMCYKAKKHIEWFPINGHQYIPLEYIEPKDQPHYLPGGNVSTVDRLFQNCHKAVCVWILTPDDCRKILWNNLETAKNILEIFNTFIYTPIKGYGRPIDAINTIYGLWLALVMYEQDNLLWDGQNWRATNTSA